MRNKSFPYYEDWLVLFGNDRATGDLAEGPTDFVAAIEIEEATKEQGLSPLFYNSVLLTWSPCQSMVGPHVIPRTAKTSTKISNRINFIFSQ